MTTEATPEAQAVADAATPEPVKEADVIATPPAPDSDYEAFQAFLADKKAKEAEAAAIEAAKPKKQAKFVDAIEEDGEAFLGWLHNVSRALSVKLPESISQHFSE